YFRLASFYFVFGYFILFFDKRKRLPQVYNILVALVPLVEHGELLYYFVLYLFNLHSSYFFSRSDTAKMLSTNVLISAGGVPWSKDIVRYSWSSVFMVRVAANAPS